LIRLKDAIKRTEIWAICSFLLPFSVYMTTLAPSVTFYDSGEFVTAVYGLGSAHSPGYPLFLVFAKPFTWLPIGSFAFKVNLATAVSASLACLALYLLISSLLIKYGASDDSSFSLFIARSSAFSGALIYGFSPRLWLQTNHDKPYPLLAFMVAIIFLLLVKWQEEVEAGEWFSGRLYAACFIAGLATGAHQIIVLFIPAWLVYLLLIDKKFILRVREILIAVFFAISGAAVQLYLPLRASSAPIQNWGDTSSFSRLVWHLLRKGYPEEPHQRSFGLLFKQLGAFDLSNEFGWVGVIFLLLGCVAAWRGARTFLYSAVISAICFLAVIAGYFNPEQDLIFLTEEFYTPLYLVASVLIGAGLFAIINLGISRADMPDKLKPVHYILVLFFCMMVPFFQAATHYNKHDQSSNYLAHEYAANTLRTLPENAILFTWGDSGAFPLWYLNRVEKLREDLDLPHIPHLVFEWYRAEFTRLFSYQERKPGSLVAEAEYIRLIAQHVDSRPVFADFSTRQSVQLADLNFYQEGIVYRIVPADISSYKLSDSAWNNYTFVSLSRFYLNPPDQDSQKSIMIHLSSMSSMADKLVEERQHQKAQQLFQKLESVSPGLRKDRDTQRQSLK
jgi:Protein of unknown function (DUF2723)